MSEFNGTVTGTSCENVGACDYCSAVVVDLVNGSVVKAPWSDVVSCVCFACENDRECSAEVAS
jgi:hypothetical protein